MLINKQIQQKLTASRILQHNYSPIKIYSYLLISTNIREQPGSKSSQNQQKISFFLWLCFCLRLFLLYPILILNIVQLNMRIIINEGVRKYRERAWPERSELLKFVQSHAFFSEAIDAEVAIGRIETLLKKNNELGSRSQPQDKQYQRKESLEQLALYLNKDNNKQIFVLFEAILAHPKGTTYQALAKRLKTDIITVSHYCCKLKKLRLIDWKHEKQGVVMFPRTQGRQDQMITYEKQRFEISFDIKQSFLMQELGMNENIWVNISSQDSVSRGGLTNEEIKRRIMKHAENKMVRRTVEAMKYFERNAQRQGKVFEFKYKNETEQIKAEINRKSEIQSELEHLEEEILDWLVQKFPQFEGENFLLDLINHKFKDYISSLGVKQSKRQCTPLKLNRYVKALNYLHREGGMRQNELRALIVGDEKKFNIGVMHKRSLMGILQGLKNLEIVFQEEGFYYPAWVDEQRRMKRKEPTLPPSKKERDEFETPPRKRIRLDKVQKADKEKATSKDGNNNKFKKIPEKRYRLQLFAALLTVSFDKCVKKIYRKAFNRIVYLQRKKVSQKYVPQTNVLHLLESPSKCVIDYTQTLEAFYRSLDNFIEEQGRKEELLGETQNELVKFLRRNPVKNTHSLRIKYGKNWRSKFQDLEKQGVVEVDEDVVRVVAREALLI